LARSIAIRARRSTPTRLISPLNAQALAVMSFEDASVVDAQNRSLIHLAFLLGADDKAVAGRDISLLPFFDP
jgi:hypothetical protein